MNIGQEMPGTEQRIGIFCFCGTILRSSWVKRASALGAASLSVLQSRAALLERTGSRLSSSASFVTRSLPL
jgi:hypothetical protein